MAGRCGCGSSACSCLLSAGAGITVTGVGSASNPYVISTASASITVLDTPSVDLTLTGLGVLSADVEISPDAGNQLVENLNGLFVPASGTPCPAPMTIAALVALETAGTLDPCTTYRVSNWTLPSSLPGPNVLVARATSPTRLSPFVLVQTPLGAAGPDTGEFLWASSTMIQLADPSGNDIRDVGASGTLNAWVWGNPLWIGNKAEGTIFTGGYAVTSAAATAGFLVQSNDLGASHTIDLTGTLTGLILNSNLEGQPVTLICGDTFFVFGAVIGDGATISNLTTATMSISNSTVHGASVTNSGTVSGATLAVSYSVLRGTTVSVSNTGARILQVTTSDIRGASVISDTISAGAGTQDVVIECTLENSSVNFSGATAPGGNQQVRGSGFTGGSVVNLPSTAAAAAVPVLNTEVTGGSVLNVTSGGSIIRSRVACGATLTTGAFAHSSVIIDGQFVTTLTAANVNRLQNKGFSDVI